MRSTYLGVVFAALLVGAANDRQPLPWQAVLEDYRAQRDLLAAILAETHTALLASVEPEHPDLLERLTPKPPLPRPSGYGVLPEITGDAVLRPVEPTRTTYSLEHVGSQLRSALAEANALQKQPDTAERSILEDRVDRYERLTDDLRLLETQLSYHELWQPEMVQSEAFFAKQNRILQEVDLWWTTREENQSLPEDILDRIASFRPTPGLKISVEPDGSLVLPVTVVTDIQSGEFLDRVMRAVDASFSESEASRSRHFRVEVIFKIIEPDLMYPGGQPPVGTELDESDHVARFPDGSLVLTTGGASTYALAGRVIQLGPEPRSPRSLAHEFAHMLGFSDAYLRSFEGRPEDPHGVVLVEWTGLQNDLMGSPSHGRVTGTMIDAMIAAYSEKQRPGP